MPPETHDDLCVLSLRVLAMDAVQKAKSGHPGLPLGAAPMAHALWSRHLRFCAGDPKWINRDRFILSAGHGSMLLYGLLHLAGFGVSLEDIKQFRQLGSITPGHPENHLTPGVEMATGPLGQGFSSAVGMALAERTLAAQYNEVGFPIFDHFTYVLCSDGDLMEGVTNEASSFAGHQRLGKLIALYDDNGITIDGSTSIGFTEDVSGRYEALGWHVQSVDGMDIEAVDQAIWLAKSESDRPSLIRCATTIGFGSPNKSGSAKSHGAPLGEEEVALTKASLGAPSEPAFWVAPEAYESYRKIADRNEALKRSHDELFAAYSREYPVKAAAIRELCAAPLRVGFEDHLPTFEDPMATRLAGAKVLAALSSECPWLVGGSADLAESNLTHLPGSPYAQADTPEGRNIGFGVREHAMAAITNGINLHGGLRGYCSTFLIFSDYCRPSIRLAALMGVPTIFVFTHDSIGVGEDGPTHQPIEHLSSLRAIPNLALIRPADANETATAWAMALERTDGPTALSLSRQALPVLTSRNILEHPCRMGGYVLVESSREPDCILIGTGSEISLCVQAREILETNGVSTRVVSMPCTSVFESQPAAYLDSVLPANAFKVSVEAGATLGWHKFADLTIGIDTFGTSAPGDQAMAHFGFTPDAIASRILTKVRAIAATR
jgi:transketolase